jgi:hypothetical protein
MSEYTPDCWVIIRITGKVDGEPVSVDKVFGGWSSGYLYGDSWRLNSGISHVAHTEDGWDVYGYSGSVYHLHREGNRMNGLMGAVLSGWKETGDVEIIGLGEVRAGRA